MVRNSISNRGFSLIELMMVIGIISVLVSIAAPNFQHFKQLSKQSEAKANLAAIYTAEKAFQAQWDGYTGDFRDIGITLVGKLTYDVGFTAPGWMPGFPFVPRVSTYCGARMAFNTEVSYCALEPGSSQAKVIFKPAVANGPCGPAMNPTAVAFRATAIGKIGPNVPDVWTIDQDKNLCNNIQGL